MDVGDAQNADHILSSRDQVVADGVAPVPMTITTIQCGTLAVVSIRLS